MSKSRHKKKRRNAFAAFASSQFRPRPGSRALSIQQNTPTAGRLQKRPAKAWYTRTRGAKKVQGAQHHGMGKEESAESRGVVMGLALGNDFTAACNYEREGNATKRYMQ